MALIAALLLALLPSIGRIYVQVTHAGAGWTDLCTLSGLQHLQLQGNLDPAHPASTGSGHDCPYCPLLNALAGLAVLIVLLLPQLAIGIAPIRWSSIRIVAKHPCGLGSRGPPLFS
ncbi:MAG: DUF2946 family protein [Lysobacteraceae bacterium]